MFPKNYNIFIFFLLIKYIIFIFSTAVETWSAHTTVHDVMVKSDKIDEVSNLLEANNATFQVVIEDIERAIKDENPDVTDNQDRNKRNYSFIIIP